MDYSDLPEKVQRHLERAYAYEESGDLEEALLAAIAQDFLAGGNGRSGMIGAAQAHLFDAATLHAFAVQWMEREFA